MKWLSLGLLGIASSGAIGQVLPPQTMATAILGAGKAGAWDTKIVVSNVSNHPIPVTLTTQPFASSTCPSPPCNILAAPTIPPMGTFVLPSIPASSDPGLSSDPQAVFVLSPAVLFSERPAVTAFVMDGGASCNRSAALPVVADPFSASPIVLPIDRDLTTHVNLILMKALGPDPAVLFVEIFDGFGTQVGYKGYEMTTEQPSLVLVDILSQLGLGALQRGSVHVNAAGQISPTLFTAIATVVGANGVHVVQGTRIVDFIPPP